MKYLLLLLFALPLHAQLGPSRAGCRGAACAGSFISFSPAPGHYGTSQTVTLSTTIVGATMFYTLDGSTPTIASPRYLAPITISSNTTLTVITAVLDIDVTNQNQNTNVSGPPPNYWKLWCVLPGCNPGGNGTPQVTTQTFNITSPVLTGAGNSMLASIKSSASVNQTNALLVDHLGDCTSSCVQWMHDFYIYYDPTTFANLSQSEHDQYWFDQADGIRYMFGMQWDKAGGNWQLVGNSNVPWTNSGVTTALSSGAWNHIQLLTHRDPSELITNPCVDGAGNHWPYLYYDQLNLDPGNTGTLTINQLNQKYCANDNPIGFASEGMQHQINIFAKNVTEKEYYSRDNFIAAEASSTPVVAVYTIP